MTNDSSSNIIDGDAYYASKAANQPLANSQPSQQGSGDALVDAAKRYKVNPQVMIGIRDRGERSAADAISPKGAEGRMQLMPSTSSALGVVNPFNESEAFDASSRLMRDNIARLKRSYPTKSEEELYRMAVANYIGGEAASTNMAQGKPVSPEVQAYVDNVMKGITFSKGGQTVGQASVNAGQNAGADVIDGDAYYAQQAKQASLPKATYDETARLAKRKPAPFEPTIRKGWFGETIPIDAASTGSANAVEGEKASAGSRVVADTAIRAGSAGILSPNMSTTEERNANPGAVIAGNLLGSVPWVAATGGLSLPKQAGILASRAAGQTSRETNNVGDIATSAAIEGGMPYAGKVVGGIAKGANRLAENLIPGYSSVANGLTKVGGQIKSGIAKYYAPGSEEAAAAIKASKAELDDVVKTKQAYRNLPAEQQDPAVLKALEDREAELRDIRAKAVTNLSDSLTNVKNANAVKQQAGIVGQGLNTVGAVMGGIPQKLANLGTLRDTAIAAGMHHLYDPEASLQQDLYAGLMGAAGFKGAKMALLQELPRNFPSIAKLLAKITNSSVDSKLVSTGEQQFINAAREDVIANLKASGEYARLNAKRGANEPIDQISDALDQRIFHDAQDLGRKMYKEFGTISQTKQFGAANLLGNTKRAIDNKDKQ